MPNRFSLTVITLLLIWISFFPQPIQEKYHLATKAFIITAFINLLIKKRTSIFKLTDFPLWFFIIVMGINVFFAQHRDIAFRTYIDLAIPMFLIYYLAGEVFSSSSRFVFFVRTISILSILVSLIGIFEALFAFNPIYEYFIENPYYQRYITGFVQPISTQFHTVTLGTYLVGCLPFNFLLFRQSKSFFKSLGGIGIIFNTALIILTFSRGVFFGMVAVIVFYLFAQKRRRLMIIFFIILFIFIIISSFLPYPFSRFGVIGMAFDDGGIISSYRFNRYIMTYNAIKDHPLVGLGFQHIRIRFNEYYPSQDIILPYELMINDNFYRYYPSKQFLPYELMIADNMYLTILGETGIIGFLGFLIFILFLFRKIRKQFRILERVPEAKQQLLIILSASIGLFVNMLGYELFYWPNQYIYFCILIGCLSNFVDEKLDYNHRVKEICKSS